MCVSSDTGNKQWLFLQAALANDLVIKAQYVFCDVGIEM
jgi:hypothetical protein